MRLTATDTLASTLELYAAACQRSRVTTNRVETLDTDAAVGSFGRGPVNLRWVLTHLIAETARHLDLLADQAAE